MSIFSVWNHNRDLEKTAETLLELLPHGSGIDKNWYYSYSDTDLRFDNSFGVMSDRIISHTVLFEITFDLVTPSQWKLELFGATEEEMDSLHDYLKHTIALEIDDFLQSLGDTVYHVEKKLYR